MSYSHLLRLASSAAFGGSIYAAILTNKRNVMRVRADPDEYETGATITIFDPPLPRSPLPGLHDSFTIYDETRPYMPLPNLDFFSPDAPDASDASCLSGPGLDDSTAAPRVCESGLDDVQGGLQYGLLFLPPPRFESTPSRDHGEQDPEYSGPTQPSPSTTDDSDANPLYDREKDPSRPQHVNETLPGPSSQPQYGDETFPGPNDSVYFDASDSSPLYDRETNPSRPESGAEVLPEPCGTEYIDTADHSPLYDGEKDPSRSRYGSESTISQPQHDETPPGPRGVDYSDGGDSSPLFDGEKDPSRPLYGNDILPEPCGTEYIDYADSSPLYDGEKQPAPGSPDFTPGSGHVRIPQHEPARPTRLGTVRRPCQYDGSPDFVIARLHTEESSPMGFTAEDPCLAEDEYAHGAEKGIARVLFDIDYEASQNFGDVGPQFSEEYQAEPDYLAKRRKYDQANQLSPDFITGELRTVQLRTGEIPPPKGPLRSAQRLDFDDYDIDDNPSMPFGKVPESDAENQTVCEETGAESTLWTEVDPRRAGAPPICGHPCLGTGVATFPCFGPRPRPQPQPQPPELSGSPTYDAGDSGEDFDLTPTYDAGDSGEDFDLTPTYESEDSPDLDKTPTNLGDVDQSPLKWYESGINPMFSELGYVEPPIEHNFPPPWEEPFKLSPEGAVEDQYHKLLFGGPKLMQRMKRKLHVPGSSAIEQYHEYPNWAPFREGGPIFPHPEITIRRVIEFNDFLLCYDNQTKQPAWTLEIITRNNINIYTPERFSPANKRDPNVDDVFCSDLNDYLTLGRRYREANVADPRLHPVDLEGSAVYSNVVPQRNPPPNRPQPRSESIFDEWFEYIKFLTRHHDKIYVLSGPLYLPSRKNIKAQMRYEVFGKHKVAVPSHYFKVIVGQNYTDKLYRFECYKVENEYTDLLDLAAHHVSRTQLESEVGFLIFRNIDDRQISKSETEREFAAKRLVSHYTKRKSYDAHECWERPKAPVVPVDPENPPPPPAPRAPRVSKVPRVCEAERILEF